MHADERTLFRSPAFLTSSSGNHQHPAVFAHGYVAICQTDRRHYVEELMEGANSLMRQIIQYMPQREDESNTNVCISSSERVDEEQSAGQSGDARSNSQVVEQSDEPKHPKYASRSARHHSFENWLKHRTHSPTDMASAGFFYAGRKDICWCFFCGGGLENWEPNDKPWTEHARWYQNCAFVRQCKGEEFIIEQRHRNLPNAIINNRHQGLTEDSRNSVIKDCELNRLPAVRAVTEMGYDLCLVKKTYNDLQKGATTDINAAVLLEAIFQIQDQESEL